MPTSHATGDEGRVELVSTRIALDGRTETCDDCEGIIEPGERYKVAAVNEGARTVDRRFCTEDCLESWRNSA